MNMGFVTVTMFPNSVNQKKKVGKLFVHVAKNIAKYNAELKI